ncbi:MAG: toll/interleukin-1 receptor domain-containing protein [Myxococcales bacterium]|nr:MAG: toll/interleukin-1 receptor domain-containing protein [Myxococcales bacterium]
MPAKLFISYSRTDKAVARLVADALKHEGYDVFWDVDIPPGQRFDAYILSQLEQSDVVIVLWSTHSVASDFVKEEAEHAKTQSRLVPVRIDDTGLPFGFARIQTTDLLDWHGSTRDPEWRRVVDAIESSLRMREQAAIGPEKVDGDAAQVDRTSRSTPAKTEIPQRKLFSGPAFVTTMMMLVMLAGIAFFLLRML